MNPPQILNPRIHPGQKGDHACDSVAIEFEHLGAGVVDFYFKAGLHCLTNSFSVSAIFASSLMSEMFAFIAVMLMSLSRGIRYCTAFMKSSGLGRSGFPFIKLSSLSVGSIS